MKTISLSSSFHQFLQFLQIPKTAYIQLCEDYIFTVQDDFKYADSNNLLLHLKAVPYGEETPHSSTFLFLPHWQVEKVVGERYLKRTLQTFDSLG